MSERMTDDLSRMTDPLGLLDALHLAERVHRIVTSWQPATAPEVSAVAAAGVVLRPDFSRGAARAAPGRSPASTARSVSSRSPTGRVP